MNQQIEGIIPVGAPWGGPESFKFTSCFASLHRHLDKENSVRALYCDRDIKVCDQCNQCGEMVWERKCHEQIYHDFLTLSGVSCYTLWPGASGASNLICSPLGFTDEEYIWRTMDFSGYSWRSLARASREEMRQAVCLAIDAGAPVLGQHLVNEDWCLVSGYEEDGAILTGFYVDEASDDPARKPERREDGRFAKSNWYHDQVRFLFVAGERPARQDLDEVFPFLSAVLRAPNNASTTAGLAAYAACKADLLDEGRIQIASRSELEQFFRLTHAFIGVLAESRCFAAFAFWAGFFGRIPAGQRLEEMKKIGDAFMHTHNECWGAWAVLGKDHLCQPEIYLDKFIQPETRARLAAYLDLFRANDEKAIQILDGMAMSAPA